MRPAAAAGPAAPGGAAEPAEARAVGAADPAGGVPPGGTGPTGGADRTAFGRFFLPGPTEVRPEILAAMLRPVFGHRGPEMRALLAGIDPKLRSLFRTRRPVYVSTSSATGLMEAGITNLVARRALCLVAGAFGERFHAIARACGREADALRVEWGEASVPGRVREALRREPGRYDAVTVVHSETSTGVLDPVREIADVVREEEDVLLLVDGVTSVAAAPVEFDAWGIDFLLTGSQKALALPPGLALAAASERALERAGTTPARGYYFDLLAFERNARAHETTNTPAVSLLFALERQLERIEAEGLAARWARHRAMAERTAAWVEELAVRSGRAYGVLARAGRRSPTVTAVTLPSGVSGPAVAAALRARGWTIAAGYGKLRETTIRIGHMGDHTMEELEALLAELGEVLEGSHGG